LQYIRIGLGSFLGANARYLVQQCVAEVMTGRVISITPETSLQEALQLLLTYRIKRSPVVNQAGQLVGLVGRGGILQALGQTIARE